MTSLEERMYQSAQARVDLKAGRRLHDANALVFATSAPTTSGRVADRPDFPAARAQSGRLQGHVRRYVEAGRGGLGSFWDGGGPSSRRRTRSPRVRAHRARGCSPLGTCTVSGSPAVSTEGLARAAGGAPCVPCAAWAQDAFVGALSCRRRATRASGRSGRASRFRALPRCRVELLSRPRRSLQGVLVLRGSP